MDHQQQQPVPPMNEHQQQQTEHQPEHIPYMPSMSHAMHRACVTGRTLAIALLISSGEGVNTPSSQGTTPLMLALRNGHLQAAKMMVSKGGDLLQVNNNGSNALHWVVANGGNLRAIEWVLSTSRLDVNSSTTTGRTPIMFALLYDQMSAANLLVSMGANLFMRSSEGRRAIDRDLGPSVLEHAKYLRFQSIRPLLLLSAACVSPTFPLAKGTPQSLVAVFCCSDMVRLIADFILRVQVIVRDPEDVDEEKEPDDVKRRFEASLAKSAAARNGER
jgi:hypothetical protein